MSKWLVDSVYQTAPTKVDVISESECYAEIRIVETGWSGKFKKENQIFDTFEEARQYMVDRLEKELEEINRQGYLFQERLERLSAMEEPHD